MKSVAGICSILWACAVVAGHAATPVAAAPAAPVAAVTPGELVVETPTLIALGFEWYVSGDENTDATVTVSYRRQGAREWSEALPLLRVDRDDHAGQYGPPVARADRPNLFAGSILDLQPDTAYEVRLAMSDPDGVRGNAVRTVQARTRAEPVPAAGGRVFHVYPPDFKGTPQQPAFIGLLAAYYDASAIAADHYNVYPPRVRPGDTILVHAGLYKDNWHYYAQASVAIPESGQWPAQPTCCGGNFHGTNFLIASGTADRPIVIKAAGDGEVIFDGDGNWTLFNVQGGNYHYFEGLTFRNTQVAIEAGQKGIAGAVGLVVKHCRFENVGEGIHDDWGGSRDFYIADNVFIGRHDPELLVPFALTGAYSGVYGSRFLSRPGVTPESARMLSQYAVKVYGSGHVIAFNTVRNFHDGIDHATYGLPDAWPHTPRNRLPVAVDIYNNDISNVHDDCIEADGGVYNFRVLRNRCVNAAGSAISTQPIIEGPVYIVRNVAYHVPGSFAALKTVGSPGMLVYNNTFIAAFRTSFAPTTHSDFRNNLFLAEFPGEPAFTAYDSESLQADYNGYRNGGETEVLIRRMAVPPPGSRVGNARDFATPTAAFAATGQDAHSIAVGYSVFANLNPPDSVQITHVYAPESLDFRLRSAGAAVDAGTRLPNVTDGFSGRAPDLGAIEAGESAPHYGARP